jgi:A/G-specific adenine glycosylase
MIQPEESFARFNEAVWDYYHDHGRHDLPWRSAEANGSFDPYKITVSELMLQQTQVSRVIQKFRDFLNRFPNVETLASAELGDVLRVWQGLGYNRRAKFLWQTAQQVTALGSFPRACAELVRLPGIGANTAGAILVYAYNEPAVFVETNIRTVYIHHFMPDELDVPDKAVIELVAQTVDREHPREFYWALMDYGTHLKATVGNLNSASKHYARQSTFTGSRRQVRGLVLRALSAGPHNAQELQAAITDKRLEGVIEDLVSEGLIRNRGDAYAL